MVSLKKLGKKLFPGDPLGGLDRGGWLESAREAEPDAIALLHPDWRGVASSAKSLFPVWLPIRDNLTRASAGSIADLLIETGCEKFVVQAFPLSYAELIDAVHERRPGIEFYAIWYGSFHQSGERYGWRSFRLVKQLAAEGTIRRLGFAKVGMAEVMNGLGIPASLVLSTVPKPPNGPSVPDAGGPHLGVWAVNLSNWRKLPFAMLAAAGMIEGATVHLSGADDRVREFARELDIPASIRAQPIPQAELPATLRRMHVNLYATLSECCPMLPLESLAEGVPCLLGPNSHLFEECPYLFRRLVVPFPDRNDVIAKHIRIALEERAEIVRAYARWLPQYNERARRSVRELIDLAPAETVAHGRRAA